MSVVGFRRRASKREKQVVYSRVGMQAAAHVIDDDSGNVTSHETLVALLHDAQAAVRTQQRRATDLHREIELLRDRKTSLESDLHQAAAHTQRERVGAAGHSGGADAASTKAEEDRLQALISRGQAVLESLERIAPELVLALTTKPAQDMASGSTSAASIEADDWGSLGAHELLKRYVTDVLPPAVEAGDPGMDVDLPPRAPTAAAVAVLDDNAGGSTATISATKSHVAATGGVFDVRVRGVVCEFIDCCKTRRQSEADAAQCARRVVHSAPAPSAAVVGDDRASTTTASFSAIPRRSNRVGVCRRGASNDDLTCSVSALAFGSGGAVTALPLRRATNDRPTRTLFHPQPPRSAASDHQ